MRSLRALFSGQSLELGLDPGAAGIKIVVIRRPSGAKGARVAEHHLFPMPLEIDSPGRLTAWRTFLKERDLQGRRVACGLDHPSLKLHRLDLPKMPEADLKEAVRWQMRDSVEGSIEDYVVGHQVLAEYTAGETSRLTLMGYAVLREAVAERMMFLRQSGLKPALLGPSAVALAAAFESTVGWRAGETYGLVDIGASHGILVVVSAGKILLERRLSEALIGLPNGTFEKELAIEIQKGLDAYAIASRSDRLEKIYLTGGRSGSEGLAERVGQTLGVETHPLLPFEEEGGGRFSIALGLALQLEAIS